jgi:ABC-type nickel/cobalt efflux system permease component RcnA
LALAHPWLALIVVVACSLVGALVVWLVWRTLWKGMRWLLRQPAGKPGALADRDAA